VHTPEGRVNRKGQPVLYVASSRETAIAEKRPWKSAAVAVAELHTKRATTIIDLVDEHAVTDPFTDELLRWKVQLSVLFDRLSYQLSLPVSPSFADRDYKTTQELCAVKYQSSVAPGFNIAFFDVDVASVSGITYAGVDSVVYSTSDVNSGPFYESMPYDYVFRKE